MMKGMIIAIWACLLLVGVLAKPQNDDTKCEKEKFKGCTLKVGECVCGKEVACKNPWPFKDEAECEQELNGQNDKCLNKEPCLNGQCVQVNLDGKRKWQCACAGTGFYGRRCEIDCPPEDQSPFPIDFPAACIY